MRLHRLDFLRGIAILGMLVANVPWHVGNSMSRVIEADLTSVSAWIVQYLIFDSRFLPLFCFLFGASFLILRNKYVSFSDFRSYFLQRMIILFLLGVAHAYLLWPGDILITYSICGLLLLLFERCSAVQLIIWGILFKCVNLIFGQWPEVYDNTIRALLFSWWVDYGDSPMTISEAYAGSYLDLLEYNAWRNQFLQWTALPYFRIWNALGLMLVGMGLFRFGILQGERPAQFYRQLVLITSLIGIPLVIYGVFARIGMNPTVGPWLNFTTELPLHNITFRTGCTMLSISILSLVHLYWHKLAGWFRKTCEDVGRLALTNYLLQSLVLLVIFHSLKLLPFDQLDHDVMLLLVIAMWAVHIVFSSLWNKYYKQGPIESVYRYLATIKQ